MIVISVIKEQLKQSEYRKLNMNLHIMMNQHILLNLCIDIVNVNQDKNVKTKVQINNLVQYQHHYINDNIEFDSTGAVKIIKDASIADEIIIINNYTIHNSWNNNDTSSSYQTIGESTDGRRIIY